LKDAPALLELAIWKSKIDKQTDGIIGMKMECRIDSLSMVVIIVPCVLSFVTAKLMMWAVIWTMMMTVVKTTMYLIFINRNT
jgi:hypothetical protein